jgi:precorrin-3B synthase
MQQLDAGSTRRGWCPTVRQPMQTGDGLLVRLHPPRARLTAPQARAIAAAARSCGNGLIDLSGRGNLQLRGIRSATHADLVETLSAAGMNDVMGAARCIVPPMAGLDPSALIDALRLADEIDAALGMAEGAEAIPPKLAIVVDGGGLPLDDVEADIRLVAIDSTRTAVALAGSDDDVWIGACTLAEAPAVILAIVSAFCAAMRAGSPARRIRDLSEETRQHVVDNVALATAPPARVRAASACVGPISSGGAVMAVGLGLPFGRLDADILDTLAEWSLQFGSGELRLSPWRSIFVPGLAESSVPTLLALAADAGLIVEASDVRRAIAACPGAPACARASVATHADAARLAAEAVPGALEQATIHLSGCAKGCARRAPADLTLVGEDGGYAVVIRGNAQAQPCAHMSIATIVDRLHALQDEGSLASLSSERLARAFEEPG